MENKNSKDTALDKKEFALRVINESIAAAASVYAHPPSNWTIEHEHADIAKQRQLLAAIGSGLNRMLATTIEHMRTCQAHWNATVDACFTGSTLGWRLVGWRTADTHNHKPRLKLGLAERKTRRVWTQGGKQLVAHNVEECLDLRPLANMSARSRSIKAIVRLWYDSANCPLETLLECRLPPWETIATMFDFYVPPDTIHIFACHTVGHAYARVTMREAAATTTTSTVALDDTVADRSAFGKLVSLSVALRSWRAEWIGASLQWAPAPPYFRDLVKAAGMTPNSDQLLTFCLEEGFVPPDDSHVPLRARGRYALLKAWFLCLLHPPLVKLSPLPTAPPLSITLPLPSEVLLIALCYLPWWAFTEPLSLRPGWTAEDAEYMWNFSVSTESSAIFLPTKE